MDLKEEEEVINKQIKHQKKLITKYQKNINECHEKIKALDRKLNYVFIRCFCMYCGREEVTEMRKDSHAYKNHRCIDKSTNDEYCIVTCSACFDCQMRAIYK